MRIAAIADLHCRVDTNHLIADILGGVQDVADVLVLAGDLTDTGLIEEARCLSKQLNQLHMPIIGVLVNHDHESGRAREVADILNNGSVSLLDGTSIELGGVGFVGTKGFGGGFGPHLVQPFGENEIKRFICSGIDEADRLQAALSQVHTPHKLAIMHYSPIEATLVGEPKELYPFLGCSRFAEAVDCAGADLILHGHAHHGSPIGTTPGNIPVYNVSRYVKCGVTDRPYCLVHLNGEAQPALGH